MSCPTCSNSTINNHSQILINIETINQTNHQPNNQTNHQPNNPIHLNTTNLQYSKPSNLRIYTLKIITMSEKHYDSELIRQMSRGNPQFVRQMLLVFVEDAPQSLEKIRQGIENRDYEAIRKQAHSLKSSIDLLHINRSKTIVRQIEELSHDRRSIEEIKTLYLSMESNINEVIEAIHRDLTA